MLVTSNCRHVCLRRERKPTGTLLIVANFQAGVRTWVFVYTKQTCCRCNEIFCLNNKNINDRFKICVAPYYSDGDLTKTR
jgi:hypothetical protein